MVTPECLFHLHETPEIRKPSPNNNRQRPTPPVLLAFRFSRSCLPAVRRQPRSRRFSVKYEDPASQHHIDHRTNLCRSTERVSRFLVLQRGWLSPQALTGIPTPLELTQTRRLGRHYHYQSRQNSKNWSESNGISLQHPPNMGHGFRQTPAPSSTSGQKVLVLSPNQPH